MNLTLVHYCACFSQQIQTWTEKETPDKARDIIVENNYEPTALVTSFVPYTKNFARVLVFNGAHDGPPSDDINFVTPEGSKSLSMTAVSCYSVYIVNTVSGCLCQ